MGTFFDSAPLHPHPGDSSSPANLCHDRILGRLVDPKGSPHLVQPPKQKTQAFLGISTSMLGVVVEVLNISCLIHRDW